MDRVLLAAASRILPRDRWVSFSPQTLLRWHRELVRRKWTYRSRRTKIRATSLQAMGDRCTMYPDTKAVMACG
jgi:hypothetical protein